MARLIFGGSTRNSLKGLLLEAEGATTHVHAAVAYATEERLLFEWCDKHDLPLTFWGRFDGGMPIQMNVLRWFASHSNLNVECKLVRKHHAKVIWWHGFGAYIGSANLTDPAWYKNFEAGTFFTEEELEMDGMREELRLFFQQLDEKASPLTKELMQRFEKRSQELSNLKKSDTGISDFESTDLVKPNDGFHVHRDKNHNDIARQYFVDEWNSTLEILRRISRELIEGKFVPNWVNDHSVPGAIVDQFLHTHYYANTFDGRRANYELLYRQNHSNPHAAVRNTMLWWSKLEEAPNFEELMLNKVAPKFREVLSAEKIGELDFRRTKFLTGYIHSMVDHARRIPNREQGLPEGQSFPIEEKTELFAKYLVNATNKRGMSFSALLNFVLYDGPASEIARRIWMAAEDPSYKIRRVGISMLGEISGWALPNEFPPRNGRTSKALRSLGFDVAVHSG